MAFIGNQSYSRGVLARFKLHQEKLLHGPVFRCLVLAIWWNIMITGYDDGGSFQVLGLGLDIYGWRRVRTSQKGIYINEMWASCMISDVIG